MKGIILLQKRTKLLRLTKVIKSFKKLQLFNLSNNFEQTSAKIVNKSVLGITRIFLHRINRLFDTNCVSKTSNTNARILLSAFMITKFPNDILSAEMNQFENSIYKLSIQLVESTRKIVENVNVNKSTISLAYIFNFKNTFNEFAALFAAWKQVDLQGIIEMTTIRYDALERTRKFIEKDGKFDEQTKSDLLISISNQKKSLEKNIKLVDKDFDPETFKKYSEIHHRVETNYRKAFFDKIKEDIKRDNYESIINNIKEIVNTICSLIPSRIDLQNEIRDKIDIEMIEQLIENRMFTGDTLFKYAKILFDWLKKLSSSSRTDDLDNLWNDLEEVAEKGFEYCELVPEIFKTLYKIVDLIKNDLNMYLLMKDIGINQ